MMKHWVWLAVALLGWCVAATGAPGVRATDKGLAVENATCRYEIGSNGRNLSFGPPGGKNYCEPDQPLMLAKVTDQWVGSTRVSLSGDIATVEFGGPATVVKVKLEALPTHLALTVVDVQGANLQAVQACNLVLEIKENIGLLVNAAWDSNYGACVMGCNDRSNAFGGDQARAVLAGQAYAETGMPGARFAIIGVPTGEPEPDQKLLAAIGQMELAEGLPHPMLNGVWIKQSPERFRSYLMVNDLSEANVDEVLAAAQGGFGCIEFGPWKSTPSYQPDPKRFPHGMDGLKAVCDKIHAAGMQVGLHTMQGMVGYGAKDDPYLSPKADPRLLQDKRGALAVGIDETADTLLLAAGAKDWPERGDLLVEGEIIRYEKRTDTGFEGVQRGLHGTTVMAHGAGAPVGNLVNCFPNWGNTVYCTDLETDMADEVFQRIAEVFNLVGCDMSYFDGGEEWLKQPPVWRNVGRAALNVMGRLDKPAILAGNLLYTNLSWHVITRGSPDFDPIFFGRREYTHRFKGPNPARHAKNLLTGDVGWFAPHPWWPCTDAVTPDEVLLLCLKAVGGKAPISFQIRASALRENPRLPEMLEIIRACDELKRTDYFTPSARVELTRPHGECSLEQAADGQWDLRPLQFGPPQVVNAADDKRRGWEYRNPYGPQVPFVRIRGRAKLAPYGDPANRVLADFKAGPLFTPEATAAADLTQAVALAPEPAPDGSAALAYRAENKGAVVSKWTHLTYALPAAVNLNEHRRLGLWVKANGCGGILNVQLGRPDARRDHYLPLDFSEWRYVELDAPEDARFWDYTWAYPWVDLFYEFIWCLYAETKQVDLYLNALPAGAKAEVFVGRLEGLKETAVPVRQPGLKVGGQTLTFPIALQPEDYVELDHAGRCRHFDRNGKTLATVTPQGTLPLAGGSNRVEFTCSADDNASARAEVTLAVRGEVLPNARRAGVTTARYAGLAATR